MDEQITQFMSDDIRLILNCIYEMLKQPYMYDRGKLNILFRLLEVQTLPPALVKPAKKEAKR